MLKVLLTILAISSQYVCCTRLFRCANGWLGSQREEMSKLKRCITLRGGADGQEAAADDKIKGTCIGIDLGTTYRLI